MISCFRQTLRSYTINGTRNYLLKKKGVPELYASWQKQFRDVLMQPNNVPKETWESMRKYIMESEFKPPTVDFFILQMCKHKNYPDIGINYYKFLESNSYNPTISTMCAYLNLYEVKKGPITEDERNRILKLYNYITSQYQLLDAVMSNVLATALCKIGKWQDAIEIIEKFEKTDKQFLRSGYSALITYFFNSGNIELAYKYLIASIKTGIGPMPDSYSAYIKYCLKEKDKFKERMETLFNLWSKYGIKPSKDVVNKYMIICNNIGWSAKFTTVLRSKCKVCKRILEQTDLTKEEYMLLSKAVLEQLIWKNIYYVTNPDEINSYKKFIDARKPYDIVIDGLNFIYNSQSGFSRLKQCLTYYKSNNKKTLVVGRYHMKKHVTRQKMQNLAEYFYVNDWSQDDVFLLYAAFSSGPNTVIISNDSMRQHKFALQNVELDTLFKKWQASHQYTIGSTQNYTELTTETQMDSIVQKQDNCWHIPYLSDHLTSQKRHKSSTDWACFDMCPQ